MKLLDGFTPIRGLRDQIHIRLSCEEARDALADEGMIIDRENPYRLKIAAHDLLPNHERRGDAA